MNAPFYDLEPGDGSHYLLQDGHPIARFNKLAKAEAVRSELMAELAERLEKENAARCDSCGVEVS